MHGAVNVAAIIMGAALFLGSAIVWLLIAARYVSQRPLLPFQERPQPNWNRFALLLTAVWIGHQLIARFMAELKSLTDPSALLPAPSLEAVKSNCLMNWLLILILMLMLRQSSRARLADFGIGFFQSGRFLSDGFLGFFASLAPVIVIQYGLIFAGLRDDTDQHELFKIIKDDPGIGALLWVVLAAVVVAPLVEELLYRVVLQGWLQTRLPPRTAVVLVAVLFCAVHGWPDALALVPLALILGYIYYQTYSYPAVVLVHMLFNATNLLFALSSQSG